jgi:signal transduction histidine kinase
VIDAVRETARRLRSLLFELEPPALEASLAEALEDAAAHIFDDAGTEWTVRQRGTSVLPTAVRVSAYRIARESMVNVRKHARASTLTVTVDADPAGVRVDVLDDGVGVEATRRPRSGRRHSGVVGMRDRAVVAGGWWQSAPGPAGVGTQVSFFLPTVAAVADDAELAARLDLAGRHSGLDLTRADRSTTDATAQP